MKTKAAIALLTIAGIVAGCGGSSSDTSTGIYVTRATESDFSTDALILAARVADTTDATWLSATVAHNDDLDLTAVRAAYPQVQAIHTLPAYDLHSIVVTVKPSTPWIANWAAGKPTTGEAKLDALLSEFAPDKITALDTIVAGNGAEFSLHFPQSLNMRHLADQLTAASSNIAESIPNYLVGDGNNIIQTAVDTDGTRHYTFSEGWGSCPSGCIARHSWLFTVSANDKTVSLVSESGPPVSQNPE